MPSNRIAAVLPVLSLLLGATMWGLIWYPTRLLRDAGLPGLWVVFAMYIAAMAAGLALYWTRRDELRSHPVAMTVLAASAGWCNVAFFLAVLDGHVVRVVLLFYLSPLWTVLLGRLFLGERLDGRARLVLAVAMSGAAIMLWDPSLGVPWPRDGADWLALSAGMGFSVTNVSVRYLQDVSVAAKGAANWAGVAVIAGVWLALSDPLPPPVPAGTWIGALALGPLAIVLMTVSVQYGVTRMPVHRSAVILLFELVASTISSQLLTHEVILLKEWVGGVLIAGASILSARRQVEANG